MNIIERISKTALALRGIWTESRSLKLPNLDLPLAHLTNTQALNLSGIWCAVTVLSGSIASLPLNVFERVAYNNISGKKPAADHPLYSILKFQPNPYMTAFTYKQAIVANIELSGIAYIFVYRPNYKNCELYPLVTTDTSRVKINGKYVYKTVLNGEHFTLQEYEVMPIMGMTIDGRTPINPIAKRRRSIALASAAEEQATKYYEQGAQLGGVITLAQKDPDKDWLTRFRANWKATYEGISKHHKTGILYGGATFEQLKFTAEEMQMLDTRKFSVTEIARWFNLPPHKLKDLERSTYSNIEHQSIEYVQDSIVPRVANIEEAHEWYLLAPSERGKFIIEFNVDGLLRGDIKTRYEAFQIMRQNGALSANEWRASENRNPIPHKSGDMYLVPLNMSPMDQIQSLYESSEASGKSEPSRDTDKQINTRASDAVIKQKMQLAALRRAITNSYTPLIRGTITNFLSAEIPEIRKKAGEYLLPQQPNFIEFKNFLETFYEGRAATVKQELSRVLAAYEEAVTSQALQEANKENEKIDVSKFRNNYADNFTKKWISVNRHDLNKAIDKAIEEKTDLKEAVENKLNEWETTIPAKYERNEPIRLEGAFSRAIWAAASVGHLRWMAVGKSCPYCNQMSGTVIPITGFFLNSGDSVAPEGSEPLITSSNIGHPGLHDGCDCFLIPE